MTDQHNENSGEQEADGRKDVAIPEHQVHKNGDPNGGDKEERQREQRWQKRFAIYSLVFDGIVAVSAVAGGYFIWRQLNLMRESNALLQTSIVVANRASIGVVGILPDKVNADDPCHVQVHVHNFGEVFADRIVAAMDLWIAASQKGPAAGQETGGHLHPITAVSTIAPDSDALLRIECKGFPKDLPQLPGNLRSGEWRMFVTGLVNYDDGFGLRRTMCFCGVYDWQLSSWQMCERGNAAECAEPKPYDRRPDYRPAGRQ